MLPIYAMLLAVGVSSQADPHSAASPDVTNPPPSDQFIVVPLRVHILKAADIPELDCALTDDDIARILRKVNGIWNKAGIHFGLESLLREEAVGLGRFRAARDLAKGEAVPLGVYRVLRPEATRRFGGLHVYYVHTLGVNGVYMGTDFAFVKETARLRPVPGGIDEPIPRVTSHELGHAFGLPHREDRLNLLASGTTGTRLNLDEMKRARERALNIQGARTVPDLREYAAEAEFRGDQVAARRARGWLADIPGAPTAASGPAR